MSDANAPESSPTPAAKPAVGHSAPIRRGPLGTIAIWAVAGAVVGIIAGAALGLAVVIKVGQPGESALWHAVRFAAALGLFGAVFTAAGAGVDEFFKARADRRKK